MNNNVQFLYTSQTVSEHFKHEGCCTTLRDAVPLSSVPLSPVQLWDSDPCPVHLLQTNRQKLTPHQQIEIVFGR